jgi:hypothetical protein
MGVFMVPMTLTTPTPKFAFQPLELCCLSSNLNSCAFLESRLHSKRLLASVLFYTRGGLYFNARLMYERIDLTSLRFCKSNVLLVSISLYVEPLS